MASVGVAAVAVAATGSDMSKKPEAARLQTTQPYSGQLGGTLLTLNDLNDHPLQGASGEGVSVTVRNRVASPNAVLIGRGGGQEHRELQPGDSETLSDVDIGQVFVIVSGSDVGGGSGVAPRCVHAGPYAPATPPKDAWGNYAYVDYSTSGRPFVAKPTNP
jgi:hypothetical protein